jgi:hypothetical protein
MFFYRHYRSFGRLILSGAFCTVSLAQAFQPRGLLYNKVAESTSHKRAMYHTFPPECQTQFICG